MAVKKAPKCSYCSQEFTPEELKTAVKYSRGLFHPDCFKQKKQEALQRTNRKVIDGNDPERMELEQYICKLFQIPAMTLRIRTAIDRFHSGGIAYRDIGRALRWYYDIEKHPISDAIDTGAADDSNIYNSDGKIDSEYYSIGIVPYILSRSQSFWRLIDSIPDRNLDYKNKAEAHQLSEEETVKIRRPDPSMKNNQICLVPMESL